MHAQAAWLADAHTDAVRRNASSHAGMSAAGLLSLHHRLIFRHCPHDHLLGPRDSQDPSHIIGWLLACLID